MRIRNILFVCFLAALISFSYSCKGTATKTDDGGGGDGELLGNIAEGGACTKNEDCLKDLVCTKAVCAKEVVEDPAAEDKDKDDDGIEDLVDNCVDVVNADQADLDGDKIGDACDEDMDGDSVLNNVDNCKLVENADQKDNEGDGLGDECDDDDDDDVVKDEIDNCPLAANPAQIDNDEDGIGTVCEKKTGDSPINFLVLKTDISKGDEAITINCQDGVIDIISNVVDAGVVFSVKKENVYKMMCQLDGKDMACDEAGMLKLAGLLDGEHGFSISFITTDDELYMSEACEWLIDTSAPAFAVQSQNKWRGVEVNVADLIEATKVVKYRVGYNYKWATNPNYTLDKFIELDNLPYLFNNSDATPLYNGVDYNMILRATDLFGFYNDEVGIANPQFNWGEKNIYPYANNNIENHLNVKSYGNDIFLAYFVNGSVEPTIKKYNTVSNNIVDVTGPDAPDCGNYLYTLSDEKLNRLSMEITDGRIYLAYVCKNSDKKYNLVVAHKGVTGNTWAYESMPYGADSVFMNIGTFAKNGKFYMVGHTKNSKKIFVKWLSSTPEGWVSTSATKTIIDGFLDEDCASQPSIWVDANEAAYVLYRAVENDGVDLDPGVCNLANTKLKLAYCTTNCFEDPITDTWSEVEVAKGNDIGSWGQLFKDADGCLNMVYYDGINLKIMYKTSHKDNNACYPFAELAKGSVIDLDLNGGLDLYKSNGPSSLMIDDNGYIHVAWMCNGGTECLDGNKIMYTVKAPEYYWQVSYDMYTYKASQEMPLSVKGYFGQTFLGDGSHWICFINDTTKKIDCVMDTPSAK